jgi:hypothetical protein
MSSTRSHCRAPGRPHRPVDAPVNPLSSQRYARMCPNLPSFTAEEAFLYALGRQGGICDCGDIDDKPRSEADAPPPVPPHSHQSGRNRRGHSFSNSFNCFGRRRRVFTRCGTPMSRKTR